VVPRALLFADIVESTALVQRLGDADAAALWSRHDRQAREALARHGGREIDHSDGFFVVFEAVADAARFADAYHAMLRALGMAARVGIHWAPVTLRANDADEVARGAKPLEVDGVAKPLAARIMALAGAGQTLLSGAARHALGDAAWPGTGLRSHGHYRLKGIAEPQELFELAPPHAVFLPPVDTDKAYRVLCIDGLWHPLREVWHNLPPERDAFVGRHAELRGLAAAFEDGARVVSLLGPGGIGKTRLARRYALAWRGEWPGGVCFCDLSEARTLDGIHFAVAMALGVPLGRGDAAVQLGHAIAARRRCLVILDNVEQVLTDVAACLGRWVDRAGDAGFLVTSRERLHLAGEHALNVEPLAVATDAVELFVARARAQRPQLALGDAERAHVAEAVRLLDGLPLAVELAAARVGILSPAQIVERLRDPFRLLVGARGTAARQATLRATIDWSWNLLSSAEQAALAQCSVFEGGFTVQDAEAVLDAGSGDDVPCALDLVQALVDKSLLHPWLPPSLAGLLAPGDPFFAMYTSIRDYAAQRLRACGEPATAAAQRRHGSHYARLGTDEALEALSTHGGVQRRHQLVLSLDNLVGACRCAVERGWSDIAVPTFLACWAVLEAQGPFNVGVELGQRVVELTGLPPRRRAAAALACSLALRGLGHVERADAMLDTALATARASQDRDIEAAALRHLAVTRHRQGQVDEAHRHFEAALALGAVAGTRSQQGALLANLANLQMEQGRMADARSSYGAALAIHREVGNRAAEGVALGNLGTLHHELGQADEARADYAAALAIHREAGNLLQEGITLGNLALLASEHGTAAEAAEYCREALRIHRAIGSRRSEGIVLGQIGALQHALGELAQAKAHFHQALDIHREVGNRRFEGGVLGNLGDLLVTLGDLDEAMRVLCAGEQLLREVDDPLEVAKLLCLKGRAAAARGELVLARAALGEAESIRVQLGAAPASELGRRIETLRAALG
jgi:predicted ATPase/class 3 adenylate cyclase/Tfp pilus assembly protein PilF